MASFDIEMDAQALMFQASHTAHHYLLDAIKMIDSAMEEPGYAKKHPELIGAFMKVSAMDFHTAVMKVSSQDLRDAINFLRDED